MVERLYEKLSNLLGAPYCFRVHLFLMVIASEFTLSVYINFGRLKKLKLLSQIEIAPNFYFFCSPECSLGFLQCGQRSTGFNLHASDTYLWPGICYCLVQDDLLYWIFRKEHVQTGSLVQYFFCKFI